MNIPALFDADEIRPTEQLWLIQSNIDALLTTDPLGIITGVNQRMEALTGWARADLVGAAFKDCFTDPQHAEDGIRLVLRDGKVTNYELTARGEYGRMIVVSCNASTFRDGAGRLQGVFAAARDITSQKHLERRTRGSQASPGSAGSASGSRRG